MEQEQLAEVLVSDSIVLFYRKLSRYYWLLEEHDKVKECHEKILRRTSDLLAECEVGKCWYDDIGRAYYDIGDYAKSAQFFRLALDLEGENLTVMVRIDLMALLYLSYYNVHATVEAEKILENITALLPVVKAKPETEVYRFNSVLYKLIEIYELNSKFEEVKHLKDQLIKSVRQVGAKPTVSSVKAAQELAFYFLETKDYPEAADLAEFAFQSFTHLSNNYKEQLKWELVLVQFTVGLAKCMNWNLSEGLDYFKLTANHICENSAPWTNPSFSNVHITFYFAFRGLVCPSQNILQTILPYGVRMIGRLFHTPLGMSTVEKYQVQKSKVENQALSQATKLVIATEYSLLSSVPRSITSWLLAHLTGVSRSAFLISADIWLSNFINGAYVMEKLILVSCLAYFLWCCIASIVDYCRVFVRFVLYIVILYSVHMCPSVIIHVLSDSSISWLLLTMCGCLCLSIIWLEINALLYVIILISFYLLWYCIAHYCKMFIHLCDSILFGLNPIAVWSVLLSIVYVPFFLLLGGIACGIFVEVNNLYVVLMGKVGITIVLSDVYYGKPFSGLIFCLLLVLNS